VGGEGANPDAVSITRGLPFADEQNTLWDSRYKSSLVQAETYLLACQRYIELNPGIKGAGP
jgi:hypothetical protein